MRSLVLTPPAYGRQINRTDFYAVQPDVPRIRAAVADVLAGRPVPGVVANPAPGEDPAGESQPLSSSQGSDTFQEVEEPPDPR